MRRRLLVPVALALMLVLAGTVVAAPAARLFPADTFLYLEVDANALEAGMRQLDLARMIQDPEVKDCLLPALKKVGLDTENPIETLLTGLPIRSWLDGRVAIGVRGLIVTTERPDGTLKKTLISPEHPLDVRLLHDVLGMFATAKLRAVFGAPEGRVTLRIQPDMIMTVQPGPKARATVERFLANPPPGLVREEITLGGRQVLHLAYEVPADRDLFMAFDVYADLSGDTWLIGTDRDTFTAALGGGPKDSLAASARFDTVRKRLTAGGQVLFAYVDMARIMSLVSSTVSPLVMQEAEILGLTSVRGLGLAVSMSHGGVRESLALVFDGRPRGIFRLLDALPGGLKTDDLAPAATASLVAAKFDTGILLERIKELASVLAPGTEGFVGPALARASEEIGVDIVGDLIPALGDEVSFLVFPPAGTMIPQAVMLLEVRDEEKLGRVLEVVKQYADMGGAQMRRLPMTDGADGFWFSAPGLPVQPSFVVRNGYLVGAMGAAQLRTFVRGWDELKASDETLANDEVYKTVLAALGAGSGERLTMYGFMSLRRSIPPALNTALPFAGMIEGIDEWIDLALVPPGDVVGNYLSGIGFAIQRDGNALSLDMFSPTGITPLMGAAGYMWMSAEQERQQEWQREIEEASQRRREEFERQNAELEKAMADEPFVGFNIDTESTDGLHIVSVIPGTPAEKATLEAGDVIVRVDSTDVSNFEGFRAAILKFKPGQWVTFGVKRADRMIFFRLQLGRRGDHVK